MTPLARYGQMVMLAIALAGCAAAPLAHENDSAQLARAAIERLHQADVEATLSNKADELAKL